MDDDIDDSSAVQLTEAESKALYDRELIRINQRRSAMTESAFYDKLVDKYCSPEEKVAYRNSVQDPLVRR